MKPLNDTNAQMKAEKKRFREKQKRRAKKLNDGKNYSLGEFIKHDN